MKINVDFIYPIGSIYMSVNSTNPGTLFGGTWSQLKDRFLLGAGNTYTNGNTGGAATVTLTVNRMPKHSHTIYRSTETGSFFGLTGISPNQTAPVQFRQAFPPVFSSRRSCQADVLQGWNGSPPHQACCRCIP